MTEHSTGYGKGLPDEEQQADIRLRDLILRVSADISKIRFVERNTQEIHHRDGDDFVDVDHAGRRSNVWIVKDDGFNNLI